MNFSKDNMFNVVGDFIDEGTKIKTKFPEIWRYDAELEYCRSLLNSEMTQTMIKQRFYQSKLSHYNTFADYIKSQDITTLNYKFPTPTKKRKRTKRCHQCGGTEFFVKDGILNCKRVPREHSQKHSTRSSVSQWRTAFSR